MKAILNPVLTLSFLATSLLSAEAAFLFTSVAPPNSPQNAQIRTNGNITYGTEFMVGATDLIVTSLGAFDKDLDGLGLATKVTIYNTAGVVVASATVPAGLAGSLDGDFRYASLGSSVTLSANTNYRLGIYIVNNVQQPSWDTDFTGGGGTDAVTISGDATAVDDFFGGGDVFPASPAGGDPLRWVNANVEYTLIPEASTGTLLGLGLLAAATRRRRRR